MSREIKALILDVDGTLVSGKKPILSGEIKEWIQRSKKYFYIYLFSNNPSRKRIKKIAIELDLEFSYLGGKPRKRKLLKILDKIPHSPNKIAIIGDRIFTDILVGNRLKMYTILVESVDYYGNKDKKNRLKNIESCLTKIITGGFS